jgi:hypothetical protein
VSEITNQKSEKSNLTCKVIRTHLIKKTLEKAEEKIYNGQSRNNCTIHGINMDMNKLNKGKKWWNNKIVLLNMNMYAES